MVRQPMMSRNSIQPLAATIVVVSGREKWRSELVSKPSKHDCNLIDANGDGVKDCIVVGDHGLMTAVNPINGERTHVFPPLSSFDILNVEPKPLPVWK